MADPTGIRVAMVCASNQNRSMEAHALLVQKNVPNVRSFGTSQHCKLPGPSIDKPNIYPFGTPYRRILEELRQQNPELYKGNGILKMLDRNSKVKEAPERWQDEKKAHFDVVCIPIDNLDDRETDLRTRSATTFEMIHVFNIQTKDNHKDAAIGAAQAYSLYQILAEHADWRDRLDTLIEQYSRLTQKSIIYSIGFY
ncbi:hypothetical protein PROFUN_13529 [Planoprotostelium fungivorum]|uniref:RNA polymerase II subunit A C-terminal domain phosphatase SSU72 n=1 Tax=Planoprotostelium fungivorum TaxID=1890364 RepID=A0A2P6N3I8_9EUKA|nr:hypothetical protein PROFUN_13529 [Planoprotostelium fungivorum]